LDYKRTEIMPGVMMTSLQTDRFKTGCLSINLLSPLSPNTASMNALIPFIMRRGTMTTPNMRAMAIRLEEMYGTEIVPVIRRIGEIHSTGFYASFPDARYLPGKEDVLPDVSNFLGEMILAPRTRGGLFLPDIVDSEKEKLDNIIRSRINNRQGYALQRCIEEMCRHEAFATMKYGSEKTLENVHYVALTQHYHDLLSTCPIEIFYCGSTDPETVADQLRTVFVTLPRRDLNTDIKTEVRMTSVEETPRVTKECKSVSQGKLVIGSRLGSFMEPHNIPAIRMFNDIYGGSVTSKLFENVREKLSLCYYASSFVETHKGLMFVSSGIDPKNYDSALDEIFRQLEDIRNGNISEDEMRAARNGLVSSYRALEGNQGSMESYYLANVLEDEAPPTPDETAALIEKVTKDDVVAAANSIQWDQIYFLYGDGEEVSDVVNE